MLRQYATEPDMGTLRAIIDCVGDMQCRDSVPHPAPVRQSGQWPVHQRFLHNGTAPYPTTRGDVTGRSAVRNGNGNVNSTRPCSELTTRSTPTVSSLSTDEVYPTRTRPYPSGGRGSTQPITTVTTTTANAFLQSHRDPNPARRQPLAPQPWHASGPLFALSGQRPSTKPSVPFAPPTPSAAAIPAPTTSTLSASVEKCRSPHPQNGLRHVEVRRMGMETVGDSVEESWVATCSTPPYETVIQRGRAAHSSALPPNPHCNRAAAVASLEAEAPGNDVDGGRGQYSRTARRPRRPLWPLPANAVVEPVVIGGRTAEPMARSTSISSGTNVTTNAAAALATPVGISRVSVSSAAFGLQPRGMVARPSNAPRTRGGVSTNSPSVSSSHLCTPFSETGTANQNASNTSLRRLDISRPLTWPDQTSFPRAHGNSSSNRAAPSMAGTRGEAGGRAVDAGGGSVGAAACADSPLCAAFSPLPSVAPVSAHMRDNGLAELGSSELAVTSADLLSAAGLPITKLALPLSSVDAERGRPHALSPDAHGVPSSEPASPLAVQSSPQQHPLAQPQLRRQRRQPSPAAGRGVRSSAHRRCYPQDPLQHQRAQPPTVTAAISPSPSLGLQEALLCGVEDDDCYDYDDSEGDQINSTREEDAAPTAASAREWSPPPASSSRGGKSHLLFPSHSPTPRRGNSGSGSEPPVNAQREATLSEWALRAASFSCGRSPDACAPDRAASHGAATDADGCSGAARLRGEGGSPNHACEPRCVPRTPVSDGQDEHLAQSEPLLDDKEESGGGEGSGGGEAGAAAVAQWRGDPAAAPDADLPLGPSEIAVRQSNHGWRAVGAGGGRSEEGEDEQEDDGGRGEPSDGAGFEADTPRRRRRALSTPSDLEAEDEFDSNELDEPLSPFSPEEEEGAGEHGNYRNSARDSQRVSDAAFTAAGELYALSDASDTSHSNEERSGGGPTIGSSRAVREVSPWAQPQGSTQRSAECEGAADPVWIDEVEVVLPVRTPTRHAQASSVVGGSARREDCQGTDGSRDGEGSSVAASLSPTRRPRSYERYFLQPLTPKSPPQTTPASVPSATVGADLRSNAPLVSGGTLHPRRDGPNPPPSLPSPHMFVHRSSSDSDEDGNAYVHEEGRARECEREEEARLRGPRRPMLASLPPPRIAGGGDCVAGPMRESVGSSQTSLAPLSPSDGDAVAANESDYEGSGLGGERGMGPRASGTTSATAASDAGTATSSGAVYCSCGHRLDGLGPCQFCQLADTPHEGDEGSSDSSRRRSGRYGGDEDPDGGRVTADAEACGRNDYPLSSDDEEYGSHKERKGRTDEMEYIRDPLTLCSDACPSCDRMGRCCQKIARPQQLSGLGKPPLPAPSVFHCQRRSSHSPKRRAAYVMAGAAATGGLGSPYAHDALREDENQDEYCGSDADEAGDDFEDDGDGYCRGGLLDDSTEMY